MLFTEAVEHILRICRVLALPRGHALLVGVGGSGRQSLSKLAGYFSKIPLHTLSSRRNYKESSLREDLAELFPKFVEDTGRILLLTDASLRDEGCLELINGLLTTGPSPNLFEEDTKANLRGLFREECRKNTNEETAEALWEYFVEKAKARLHIILCMSPAGDTLRNRCRAFPGILSATTLDWFGPWPAVALLEVALATLQEEQVGGKSEADFAVKLHADLPNKCADFLRLAGRKVHVTPRHFLDCLSSFSKLLKQKRALSETSKYKYDNGLKKLEETAQSVQGLREAITEEKARVEQEKLEVETLLEEIRVKSSEASV